MSEFVHRKLKIWAAISHIFYTFQYHVTVLHKWHQLHLELFIIFLLTAEVTYQNCHAKTDRK